jgi:hypothetical protein
MALPIVLGGPSGSGKSSLGEYLDRIKRWLHLEADQEGKDGIDELGLREVWNRFYERYDPVPLAQELERRRAVEGRVRVILTLPSMHLCAAHLEGAFSPLLIQFLAGPAWASLRSRTKRELAKNAVPGEAHWCENNKAILEAFTKPAYARHKIVAFQQNGRRVARGVLAQRLFDLSRPSNVGSTKLGPTEL